MKNKLLYWTYFTFFVLNSACIPMDFYIGSGWNLLLNVPATVVAFLGMMEYR